MKRMLSIGWKWGKCIEKVRVLKIGCLRLNGKGEG